MLKDLTDKELRDLVKPKINGEYTKKICRNCGEYWASPDSSINKCTFVARCKECCGYD